MILSELITILESIKSEHGNLDVQWKSDPRPRPEVAGKIYSVPDFILAVEECDAGNFGIQTIINIRSWTH